jgi:putative transposase
MSTKYKNTYRIETTRLKNWDYGSRGFYFATICTKNKQPYFGWIVKGKVQAQVEKNMDMQEGKNIDAQEGKYAETQAGNNVETQAGNNVETQAGNNVEMQNFASLRPVQILTRIGDVANKYWNEIPKHFPFVELDAFVIMPDHVHGILFLNRPKYEIWRTNAFKPQSKNLASVVRGFKAAVKKYAVIHQLEFDWQPRYYDRVVHTEMALRTIRQYIANNPANWLSTH